MVSEATLSCASGAGGLLDIIVRSCLGEAVTAAEKAVLDSWAAEDQQRAELLVFLTDPAKADLLIRAMLQDKFSPGKTPPGNSLVDWINRKSGGDLPPFYFG